MCAFRILHYWKTCGSNSFPGQLFPASLLGPNAIGVAVERFFSFHRQEAAARRSELPLKTAGEAPEQPLAWTGRNACPTGAERQGEHKSQFYNILGSMGQTADHRGLGQLSDLPLIKPFTVEIAHSPARFPIAVVAPLSACCCDRERAEEQERLSCSNAKTALTSSQESVTHPEWLHHAAAAS